MTTLSALSLLALSASVQEDQRPREDRDSTRSTKPFKQVQSQSQSRGLQSITEDGEESSEAMKHGGSWVFSDRERRGRKGKKASNSKKSPGPALARLKRPISAAGRYQGMRLGQKALSPVPTPKDPNGAPALHWVGFQRTSSSSTAVFIQLDKPVAYEISKGKKRLRIHLPGVKVNIKNHKRALDLRYFPKTKVRRVKTRSRRGQTVVDITLRQQAQPKLRVEKVEQGHSRIIVEFDNP